jgi:Leucine-rich repeat (LRR) protein
VLHLEDNFFRSIPNLTYPRNLIELSVGNGDMKSADLPSSLQLLTSLRTFSVSVIGNPLKIDKNYFKWLTKNIKKLAVVDGSVVELGDSDRCLFSDLQEFIWDTREAGLSELQETLRSLTRCSKLTAMVLYIFHEVPTLPANAFESLKYLKLQNLTLDFSLQTSVIYAGAFPYMPDLHHLSLYVITLKELQDTLSGMTNLLTFRMENEEMEMLPRFELPALREFTMSYSEGFQVCTGGIFIHTNLTSLDLSGNSLQRIESDCLDGLHNLETLDLSRNKISSIDSSVFEDVPNLLFLNLHDNHLDTLYPCFLSPLHRLHSLDLSFNRIMCLMESVEQEPCFSSLGSLHKLDISRNSLGKCLAIPISIALSMA